MAHKRTKSKTQKCCRCETETQPHSDNIVVIERERQACRCTPCYICVVTDFYGTICDYVQTVPFTKSSQFSIPSGYFTTVTCDERAIDFRFRMETDEYGECALVLSSEALGYVLTETEDTRLRHYFGPYDDACRLITTEDIVFDVEDYILGAGTVTVSRAGFLDHPMDIARCGPTSDPYQCFCGRAIITRETWDEYGTASIEKVSACYGPFPYPSTLYGWQADFDGELNDVLIWIESGGPEDPDNPLVFGLIAENYDPESLDPAESALRTVRCVTEYDDTGNMNAEWDVTQGPQPFKITIRADDHFEKYHCCKCWVDCLCVSVSRQSPSCIGRGVFCMGGLNEDDPQQRVWTYSIECEGGDPITGTIRLFCKCEDMRPHLMFDDDA